MKLKQPVVVFGFIFLAIKLKAILFLVLPMNIKMPERRKGNFLLPKFFSFF